MEWSSARITSIFAGAAGALYAHYITFVDPGVFGFDFSEVLLIMVILGGAGLGREHRVGVAHPECAGGRR